MTVSAFLSCPPRRVVLGLWVSLLVIPLVGVLVAGLVAGPAGADQAESAVHRVAAASITAGENHTCALLVTGAVRCWGENFYGQLGYDNTENVGDDPARSMEAAGDVPLGGKATAVVAGDIHTCALLGNGAVRCWGNGDNGDLGHNSTESIGNGIGPSIKEAGDVPLGGTATAIAAGESSTCALLTTGAVRCWGYGGDGELGHDNTDSVGDGIGPSIKDAGNVPLGGTATAITAGKYHTCALLTTGAVRCWGYGGDGELGHNNTGSVGDGTGSSIESAQDVLVGGKATAIAAGGYHTCALLATGAVRCWGYGFDGELGHNNPGNIGDGGADFSIKDAGDVPVGGTATAIAAGAYHTCAVLATGAVRCWGDGVSGQLGHDSTTNIGDDPARPIKDAGNVPVGRRVRVRATTALSASRTPTRDRHAPYVYRVTGRVHGRFVADSATCTGKVKVTVRHGRRLLRAHTTRLHADCHYRARTRITARQLHTHRSTRLTIKIHYLGTRNLQPAATTRHVTAN